MTGPGSNVAAPPTERRTLSLIDHILNVFRLVIKELRSIKADPTMLIPVATVLTEMLKA